MRNLLLLVFLTITAAQFAVRAQSPTRLQNLANRLTQQADELADRSYNDFTNRSSNGRSEIENLMFAQQLSSVANAFRRLIQDRRSDAELRDAAVYLSDFSRRATGSGNYYWRDAQRTIADIARELNIGGGGGISSGNGGRDNNFPSNNDNVIGRVRWRGSVDDEVQLVIRGSSVEVQTISGSQSSNNTFNFTSPLPNRRVNVSVNKNKGRGRVNVIQQPSRDNDFTAVVQIRDEAGGARDYDLDVIWTR